MDQSRRSCFVGRELANSALNLAEDTIRMLASMSQRPKENRFVHVSVIANELLMAERTFGEAPENRNDWKNPYDQIALSKAWLSMEHRMHTGILVLQSPALLGYTDTHYQGGVWLHGVAVGTSGVEPHLDEAISTIVAEFINAMVATRLNHFKTKDLAFLPGIGGIGECP